ncbi:hypothetical protein CLF_107072 [Clonorchis sinensis]|uniref:EF-hand domain-containing protein n=1 Tax=Clonorchis sinensis TaxID=79923 RepID=G7YG44_CLOSI|nr:hypothetical protein CLF_107072 [Clonorchis sinensis]
MKQETLYRGLLKLFSIVDLDGDNRVSYDELNFGFKRFGFTENECSSGRVTECRRFTLRFTVCEMPGECVEHELEPKLEFSLKFTGLISLYFNQQGPLSGQIKGSKKDKNTGGPSRHDVVTNHRSCLIVRKITRRIMCQFSLLDNFSKKFMRKFDKDSDGYLTLGEYKAAFGIPEEFLEEVENAPSLQNGISYAMRFAGADQSNALSLRQS